MSEHPDHAAEQPSGPTDTSAASAPGAAAAAGTSTGPAPRKPARNTLVMILAVLVVLLLAVVIGLVIALGRNGTAAPSGEASATGSAAASASASAPATLSPEEEQQVLDLIRAQPRRQAEDPYAVGAVDAPVVLIEYADYRCSYCGKWNLETRPGLQELVDDGTLRMEWRDFPVFQEDSITLAVAARAAAQQGLFWEYNAAIFRHQFVDGSSDFSTEALVALAREVGVSDLARFTADLTSQELIDEVNAEHDASLALLGQASTPQFLVNDSYVGGAQPLEYFIQAIEAELAKLPAGD